MQLRCFRGISFVICRREEVTSVFETPLLDLVHHAAVVHRMYNDPQMVGDDKSGLAQISSVSCFGAPEPCTEAGQARLTSCPLPSESHAVQVQRCTLLSIKTGGCPETCNYCAQSSSWSKDVGLKAEKLMGLEEVYEVCLGYVAPLIFLLK